MTILVALESASYPHGAGRPLQSPVFHRRLRHSSKTSLSICHRWPLMKAYHRWRAFSHLPSSRGLFISRFRTHTRYHRENFQRQITLTDCIWLDFCVARTLLFLVYTSLHYSEFITRNFVLFKCLTTEEGVTLNFTLYPLFDDSRILSCTALQLLPQLMSNPQTAFSSRWLGLGPGKMERDFPVNLIWI